jgi:hypothetical protein
MTYQENRLAATIVDVFEQRDFLMDTAYELLATLVMDLLRYTDGGAEIGIVGVPTLPGVVDCFKKLSVFCEGVIDNEGKEAVEATQEIGENGQINQRIQSLQMRFGSDMDGLSGAISRAEQEFREAHKHYAVAQDELQKAEDRKDVSCAFTFHLSRLLPVARADVRAIEFLIFRVRERRR